LKFNARKVPGKKGKRKRGKGKKAGSCHSVYSGMREID
jgi:hypothetical protein